LLEGDPEHLTAYEQQELVEAEDSPTSVSYSGQDFDVVGLVRRLEAGDILVPSFGHDDERISAAGFQRSFVWTRPQMDRFIESLLLGYPIPGIFLVRQVDRRYLVLDGQQRLKTLQAFYSGVYEGREFALQNVNDEFRGLKYRTLGEDQRRLLDNTFLQATIVATDGSKSSLEAIYQIFERLNSGGTQLTPHEIRVALFAGPFIEYLERLNRDENWRSLYGKRSPRLRDQELVLRILALYANAPNYSRPLKGFLNNFAASNRDLSDLNTTVLGDRFREAARLLYEGVGRQALRRQGSQINAALTEALFVGLMRRLDHGIPIAAAAVGEAVKALQSDQTLASAVSRSTADEENVRARLETATAVFARA
jgi:hypothetical protein